MDGNDRTAVRICPGCGADLDPEVGPTHDYMISSPACYARFTAVLAHEYSDPALLATHRLSVDSYAVQHPGDGSERRMVQSVGLHLARLCVQLEDHAAGRPRGAEATNAVMLGLGQHKATLDWLEPPAQFAVTVADVVPYAGGPEHAARVIAWAEAAWADWAAHHDYVREWVGRWLGR